MGLDITAYGGLKRIRRITDDEKRNGYDGDLARLYANPEFPRHHGEIDTNFLYAYKHTMNFRAGSYGGYNTWRIKLARMVGIDNIEAYWKLNDWSVPFAELINFSDCEGLIGPEISRELALDFQAYVIRVDPTDREFITTYALFKQAFEMATMNGAVVFH
jgi:hypothetical protein